MKLTIKFVTILYISLNLCSFSYSEERTNGYNFYTGMFDFSDDKKRSTLFGVEHQNENLYQRYFSWKSVTYNRFHDYEANAAYVYTGIEANYDLGVFKFTPSFAPGIYSQGDGKDLGHPLEFKSEVQLSMDLGETTNFGMSYNHVSNASLEIRILGPIATCSIFLKNSNINMGLKDCHNFSDFRKLAKRKLRHNISLLDGAADDEVTYKRNTEAFNDVDLVPNVLRGSKMLIYQPQFLEKN